MLSEAKDRHQAITRDEAKGSEEDDAVHAIDRGSVGPWTRFGDVHSGGYPALPWEVIYVEGDEDTALQRFEAILGRDPRNVSCDCCGSDYGWSEAPTLEEASRSCRGATEEGCPPGYEPYPLAEYFALETILVLPADVTTLTSEQNARPAKPPEAWTSTLQSGIGKPTTTTVRAEPKAGAPTACR